MNRTQIAVPSRGPTDAARTGPSGARKPMQSTGMVLRSPATPWDMPSSAWTLPTSGPMIRAWVRSAVPTRTSAATIRIVRFTGPLPPLFPRRSRPGPEARADSRRRRPDRGGDPLFVAFRREAVRGPVHVDRGDDLGARVGDGRSHGGQPDRVLVVDPGVAIAADVAQPLQERGCVRDGAWRELLERLREVPRQDGCRQLGKEDLPG